MGWGKTALIVGGLGLGAYAAYDYFSEEDAEPVPPIPVSLYTGDVTRTSELEKVRKSAQACDANQSEILSRLAARVKASLLDAGARTKAWGEAKKEESAALKSVEWGKLTAQMEYRCTAGEPFIPATEGNNPVLAFTVSSNTLGATAKMTGPAEDLDLCIRAGALARATYCQQTGECEYTTERLAGGAPMATPNAIQKTVAELCRNSTLSTQEEALLVKLGGELSFEKDAAGKIAAQGKTKIGNVEMEGAFALDMAAESVTPTGPHSMKFENEDVLKLEFANGEIIVDKTVIYAQKGKEPISLEPLKEDNGTGLVWAQARKDGSAALLTLVKDATGKYTLDFKDCKLLAGQKVGVEACKQMEAVRALFEEGTTFTEKNTVMTAKGAMTKKGATFNGKFTVEKGKSPKAIPVGEVTVTLSDGNTLKATFKEGKPNDSQPATFTGSDGKQVALDNYPTSAGAINWFAWTNSEHTTYNDYEWVETDSAIILKITSKVMQPQTAQ